jgi:predicted dinucleotide-binding enzyme
MTTAQQSAMQAVANQLPTSRLIEAVRFVGGAVLPPPENMARAALLTAYQEREGDDALDALMDEIGL